MLWLITRSGHRAARRAAVPARDHDTIFSDERTWGALQGAKLAPDPSFGPAAQFGVDVDVIPGWFINVDVRWFDIDTDATLEGADLGTVEIDPYAFGVSIGHRF